MRSAGKSGRLGHGRRENFQAEETKSLCQGLGPGRDLTHLGKAREVARQETIGRAASVRLEEWTKVMKPSPAVLRIWVFILRAKGCY